METSEVKILKEKEVNRDEYLQKLREKLKNKGLLIEFEESFLIKFLRARVYDVDQSFAVVEAYLKNVKKYPTIFENVHFSHKAIYDGFFEILPKRNKTGETVSIMRICKWDPSTVSFESAVAATVYGFEMAEMDEETQINGAIEIVDFANVGLKQLWRLGIADVRLICSFTDESMPIRWRKLFVVRENYITDILYTMAKPFLRKEFKERVAFIGHNFSELHNMVPMDILPPEYGGTGEPLNPDAFYQKLEQFEPKLHHYWKTFKNNETLLL